MGASEIIGLLGGIALFLFGMAIKNAYMGLTLG